MADELVSRDWIHYDKQSRPDATAVTIMQWNILADGKARFRRIF